LQQRHHKIVTYELRAFSMKLFSMSELIETYKKATTATIKDEIVDERLSQI